MRHMHINIDIKCDAKTFDIKYGLTTNETEKHQGLSIAVIDIPSQKSRCEAPYLTSTIQVPQLPPPPQFINFPCQKENFAFRRRKCTGHGAVETLLTF